MNEHLDFFLLKFNENITEYDAQIPFPLTLIRGNDHLGCIQHPHIRRLCYNGKN